MKNILGKIFWDGKLICGRNKNENRLRKCKLNKNGEDCAPLHIDKVFPTLLRRHNFLCCNDPLYKALGAPHNISIATEVGNIPTI